MSKTKKGIQIQSMKKYIPFYLMLLPGALYLLVNNYIPMAGIVMAFKNLNFQKGIWGSDWVGLKNFEYLFKTPEAFNMTRNTILYNLAFIVLTMLLSVFVAILLSEIRQKMCMKLYQTVILLPYMISMVIVSYLGYAFMAEDGGLLNEILKLFGKEGISWYNAPQYWPAILIIIQLWKNVGYQSIIFQASVMGIDQEMYEAASIDGCSKVKQIFSITIPMIVPTIITMSLLQIGRIFYSDFGLFYQVPLNSGALYNVTTTIDTYVFRGLMTLGDFSMSSAACVYQSLVGFVLVLAANKITKKFSAENALF